MKIILVSSSGRITIPKKIRQQMGIRLGSKIEFSLACDHIKLRVKASPVDVIESGFGMLKSRRDAIPADFDPAILLK